MTKTRGRLQTASDANECAKCKKEEGPNEKWVQCDTCDSWYHNECSGLEPEIYPLLEKAKLLLFRCISCYEKKNLTETSRKVLKDTLKEFVLVIVKKAAEESKPTKSSESNYSQPGATPMRNSIDKEKCDYELKVSGIPEGKGEFTSNTEHEISQINSVFNHLNVNVKIKDLFRIGKKKDDSPRPRPITLRFHSTFDTRLILAKAYQLKTFSMPVFISKSLSTAEQVQMRKLLKNRHEISSNEGIAKNELRIRNLKLFHGPNEIKVD